MSSQECIWYHVKPLYIAILTVFASLYFSLSYPFYCIYVDLIDWNYVWDIYLSVSYYKLVPLWNIFNRSIIISAIIFVLVGERSLRFFYKCVRYNCFYYHSCHIALYIPSRALSKEIVSLQQLILNIGPSHFLNISSGQDQ